MAARIIYDRAYCTDPSRFKDPRCKHVDEDTTIYNGKFARYSQNNMRLVCLACGLVSAREKIMNGTLVCVFPTVK